MKKLGLLVIVPVYFGLRIANPILNFLMVIFFIADIVDLLKKFVGPLAYGLWFFVTPILLPAVIAFPWFDAWVYDAPQVDEVIFWLWLSWITVIYLSLAIYWLKEKLEN